MYEAPSDLLERPAGKNSTVWYVLTAPNEAEIKDKLLGNPNRKYIGKVWSTIAVFSATLTATQAILPTMTLPDCKSEKDFTNTMNLAKQTVGVTASCQ